MYKRNSDLMRMEVKNFNLGERVSILVKFGVSSETSTEQMSKLVSRLSDYTTKSSVWADKFVLSANKIRQNKKKETFIEIKIKAFLKNGGRWQDSLRWCTAKTTLLFEIQRIAKSLSIQVTGN